MQTTDSEIVAVVRSRFGPVLAGVLSYVAPEICEHTFPDGSSTWRFGDRVEFFALLIADEIIGRRRSKAELLDLAREYKPLPFSYERRTPERRFNEGLRRTCKVSTRYAGVR